MSAPILSLNKDFILVQKETSVEGLNQFFDSIIFHIMNPFIEDMVFNNQRKLTADQILKQYTDSKRSVSDESAIYIAIPFGNEENSFGSKELCSAIKVIPSSQEWGISEWKEVDDTVMCAIISKSSKTILEQYDCITLIMDNIVSYSQLGITEIRIMVQNVGQKGRIQKIFRVKKKNAPLGIMQFYADSQVIKEGETAKLYWKTSQKTDGKILPREFNINKGIAEYSEKLHSSQLYTLQISNDGESDTDVCPVYVSPPVINEFYFNSEIARQVKWSVSYAKKIKINGIVTESDNYTLKTSETYAALVCEGYLYTLEKVLFIGNNFLKNLTKYVYIFQGYKVVKIKWETVGLNETELVVEDGDLSRVNYKQNIVENEFAYNNKLKITLIGKTSKQEFSITVHDDKI